MTGTSAQDNQLRFIIFTDGACSGNPGPGGWGAIVVTPDQVVKELGGSESATTNNRMELGGAIAALRLIRGLPGPVDLYTDSVYVINGITKWIFGWSRNGWKTKDGGEVLNNSYWRDLSALVQERGKANPVRWHYVRGHQGNPGNERVDAISVAYSKGQYFNLYHGPFSAYDVDVYEVPADTSVPERTGDIKKSASGPAIYLSLVDSKLMRHQTWAECEARVKGRSGAKFKKVSSPTEEADTLSKWGIAGQK